MIGLDLVEIERFKQFKKTDAFLMKNFTQGELDYCFGFKDAATHLAGTFAAKEAVVKAGVARNVAEVEIKRNQNGQPEVQGAFVSITHTDKMAAAIALKK